MCGGLARPARCMNAPRDKAIEILVQAQRVAYLAALDDRLSRFRSCRRLCAIAQRGRRPHRHSGSAPTTSYHGCRSCSYVQPPARHVSYQSDGLREKELVDSDLLKLRDAADKFGKVRILASGSEGLELRRLFT
jgi:hypothetical protein